MMTGSSVVKRFRAAPVRKSCYMVQYTQAKGGQGVISQVAIGRVTKSDPIKLVVQLPIGIWLPTGVKIVRRCQGSVLAGNLQALIPQACFADVDIGNEQLRRPIRDISSSRTATRKTRRCRY